MKLPRGHPVIHFGRIDSTNAEARRLADQGEQGPLWLVADEQTAGRGRMGRTWVSQPGNLHATFLFSIAAGPEVAAQVSFVAALAVHDMVTALLPSLRPRIKWPNDVLIGGAKFCGVLPEIVGTSPTRIAIGCGVNVAHAPKDTPYPVTNLNAPRSPLLRDSGGEGRVRGCRPSAQPSTASLVEPPPHLDPLPHMRGGEGANVKPMPPFGKRIDVESVLQHLDANLSNRLKMWDEGRDFSAIREAWEARALGLGGEARSGTLQGIFHGLAADGALILATPGGHHHIHSGEVQFAELERLRDT